MSVVENIIKNKIVAVIRGNDKEEALNIIEGAIEGGIKLIEVTYTNKDASEIIESLLGKYEDVVIGAGSVLNVNTAREAVGPSYIKAIKAPIKDVKVMVTGGVNLENLKKWLNSGADSVGIGSILTSGTDGDKAKIAENARRFMEKVGE